MSKLSITLEGFPEKVQRIADILEEAFPDMMIWVLAQDITDDVTIKIEGYEASMMPVGALRWRAA